MREGPGDDKREEAAKRREKKSLMQPLPYEVLPLLATSQEGSPSTTPWIHPGHGSFLCHRGMESRDRSRRKPVNTISRASQATHGKKIHKTQHAPEVIFQLHATCVG